MKFLSLELAQAADRHAVAAGPAATGLDGAPVPPLILFPARFYPMKDVRTFLEAVRRLRNRGVALRVRLVGAVFDAENQEFKVVLDSCGSEGVVEVSGAVWDVERHMAEAAVARSSPAWGEGFQNILVKRALARAVVVSTDVGDARWIVGDPRFVVPPRDSDAIADALETALRLGSAERDAVVGDLHARAQLEFSLEVMREGLSRMFLEVAQGDSLSVHPGG